MFQNATISSYFHFQWQVSSPENLPDEARMIASWLEQNRGCFLVNKPGMGYWEMWAFLREIPEMFHHRLLLAQHHELRREFDLRGLHFSAEAPYAPEDFNGMLLGMTVNGFEDALRWGDKLNYLFLHLPRGYAREEIRQFKKGYRGRAALLDMPGIQIGKR